MCCAVISSGISCATHVSVFLPLTFVVVQSLCTPTCATTDTELKHVPTGPVSRASVSPTAVTVMSSRARELELFFTGGVPGASLLTTDMSVRTTLAVSASFCAAALNEGCSAHSVLLPKRFVVKSGDTYSDVSWRGSVC
jgi:hypothetical protein